MQHRTKHNTSTLHNPNRQGLNADSLQFVENLHIRLIPHSEYEHEDYKEEISNTSFYEFVAIIKEDNLNNVTNRKEYKKFVICHTTCLFIESQRGFHSDIDW